eukprot:362142-Prymnesium_polylepis.1
MGCVRRCERLSASGRPRFEPRRGETHPASAASSTSAASSNLRVRARRMRCRSWAVSGTPKYTSLSKRPCHRAQSEAGSLGRAIGARVQRPRRGATPAEVSACVRAGGRAEE